MTAAPISGAAFSLFTATHGDADCDRPDRFRRDADASGHGFAIATLTPLMTARNRGVVRQKKCVVSPALLTPSVAVTRLPAGLPL